MWFNFKLLVILLTIVQATFALPASHDEVSTTTDLVKRQPPGKYQYVQLKLQVFQTAVVLRFVWDCLHGRFVTRTEGAGTTTSSLSPSNTPGQFRYDMTMRPGGVGLSQPRDPSGSRPGQRTRWRFNQQEINMNMGFTLDDNNNVVLQGGTWDFNIPNYTGLTATNQYNDVSNAQVLEFGIADPVDWDPNNPPAATGSGFNTDSNDSVPSP